jgi:hypothetical protein
MWHRVDVIQGDGAPIGLPPAYHTLVIPVETPLGRGQAIIVETTAHDCFWTDGRGISDERMQKVVEQRERRLRDIAT